MKRLATSLAALVLCTGSLTVALMAPAEAAMPAKFKNCTALNKVYPHGVGKAKAVDRTSGKRVTTFRRSTKLYNQAMKYNRGLDRDKDGIACEKR